MIKRPQKQKLKVLLIQPNSPHVSEAVPLGLGYLAAMIKQQKNCEVKILDGTAPYAKYTDQDITDFCKKYSPDVIGILMMTTHIVRAYKLIEKIKPYSPLLIAGGPHATITPEEVLNHKVDLVARGEAEHIIVELIQAIRGKRKLKSIKGISYVEQEKIIHNPARQLNAKLDALPFPDKDAFIIEDFGKSEKEIKNSLCTIITSRGCPEKCIFCSKAVSGNYYRFRSAKNIIKEVKHLNKKYGITNFYFIDDTINVHKRRLKEICKAMKESGFVWSCNGRVDFIDKELLQEMKDSGCCYISYGAESGDNRILRRMKKGFAVEKVEEIVKLTHRVGIPQTINFMYGFPFETTENIRNTGKFVRKLSPYVTNFQRGGILIPFPATEVYDEFKDEYGFQDWWLYPDKFLMEVHQKRRIPLYQKVLFRDNGLLKEKGSFFRYGWKIKREIKKIIRFIDKANIKKKSKILNFTKYPIFTDLIYFSTIFLLAMSRLLYAIHPELERKVIYGAYFAVRQNPLYLKKKKF